MVSIGGDSRIRHVLAACARCQTGFHVIVCCKDWGRVLLASVFCISRLVDFEDRVGLQTLGLATAALRISGTLLLWASAV